KTAYEIDTCLEFRRVLFRSSCSRGCPRPAPSTSTEIAPEPAPAMAAALLSPAPSDSSRAPAAAAALDWSATLRGNRAGAQHEIGIDRVVHVRTRLPGGDHRP